VGHAAVKYKIARYSNEFTTHSAIVWETAPLFIGVILLAHVSDQAAVTDGMAMVYVGARVLQSVSHLISVHHLMIFLVRFPAFLVQVALLVWWLLSLTSVI